MSSEQITTRCEHRVLDDGIHEIIMHEFSRAGVDDFIEIVTAFTQSPDFGVPLLVDSSAGTQPIQYLFSRLQAMYRVTPHAPHVFKIALLHKPNIVTSMLESLMQIFPQGRLRLFRAEEREAALAWLHA